ncbi:MAG: hypothetical protein IPQ18_09685 [Saprospiraceae bacterium]|nr:hypothetical protein [Saprospiraceae bacterium]
MQNSNKKIFELDAIAKYLPIEDNEFHSEIHDSSEKVQMRGKKPEKIRNASKVVYTI